MVGPISYYPIGRSLLLCMASVNSRNLQHGCEMKWFKQSNALRVTFDVPQEVVDRIVKDVLHATPKNERQAGQMVIDLIMTDLSHSLKRKLT